MMSMPKQMSLSNSLSRALKLFRKNNWLLSIAPSFLALYRLQYDLRETRMNNSLFPTTYYSLLYLDLVDISILWSNLLKLIAFRSYNHEFYCGRSFLQ